VSVVGASGGAGALGMFERRPGVGAETRGAPRPAEGIGARPPSIATAGAGAGRGAACGAGGAGGAMG